MLNELLVCMEKSATASIDPISQLSNWSLSWLGLITCSTVAALFLLAACEVVRRREA